MIASGISEIAPNWLCSVSRSVRFVNTRMVASCSFSFIAFHAGMSLDTGIFSGSQKLPVSRSHTSRSLESSILFQLMALNGVFFMSVSFLGGLSLRKGREVSMIHDCVVVLFGPAVVLGCSHVELSGCDEDY